MRLTAYLDGVRVGWFEQRDGGRVTLEYERSWQESAGRVELSASLPKSRRLHTGDAPINYLWNLLPDNESVLQRWARTFGVSARNPLALLSHVGADAAGAVQLFDSAECDEPHLVGAGGIEPIDTATIAAHLRALRADPTAWLAPGSEGGYFSLAGAQAKFTLAQVGDRWGMPTGRAASTHIVKPGVSGLVRSDLNEHLTMRAARSLGLDVAASTVVRFEDQLAIVVRRFDRVTMPDGVTARRHQEDFAQATGIHPSAKYQTDGGPGIATIAQVIRDQLGRTAPADVARFFEATMFNWVALGTDAHAKNYALLYPQAGSRIRPELAPLYDLGSALAYPEINNRKAKLAMSYAGHYRTHEVEPRHVVREARALGLPEDWVIDRARALCDGLAAALNDAAAEIDLTGEDAQFAGMLVDRAHERTTELRRQLNRPIRS